MTETTYRPPVHCACCLNRDNTVLVEATQTVRNLRVCDEHAPLVRDYTGTDLAGLFAAVRRDR